MPQVEEIDDGTSTRETAVFCSEWYLRTRCNDCVTILPRPSSPRPIVVTGLYHEAAMSKCNKHNDLTRARLLSYTDGSWT
jgi:hypothetical protein